MQSSALVDPASCSRVSSWPLGLAIKAGRHRCPQRDADNVLGPLGQHFPRTASTATVPLAPRVSAKSDWAVI